jgi:glycosyltransferase involved in cell wall biosynthesis
LKVLLLTQVLPYPPDSGPKVKTFYVLKYLAQHHEVTLISFVRGEQSEHIQVLKSFCQSIHTVPMRRSWFQNLVALVRSLIGREPWMMVRDDVKEMRQLVDQVVANDKFDVVHADQMNMAQYGLRVHNVLRVIDAHNALWVLYQRLAATMKPGIQKWLLERDWRLLKKYEGRICSEFDQVLTVSDEDKISLEESLLSIFRNKKTPLSMDDKWQKKFHVIPIAVDTDELHPVLREKCADHIVHIGTMYWPPNIDGVMWFLEKVFPLIQEKCPGVIFDIIGARPPQSMLDYAKSHPEVNVTGYVVDPTPLLQKAGVMVVPLRAGGGMRVKILNALAQGLPIVSTTLGSEGILVEHGKHVIIADDPVDFADATIKLLNDPEMASSLGKNGRALIQKRYDYRSACATLERIYTS